NNLGSAFLAVRRLAQAESSYRRALVLKPDFAAAQSNLLFMLQYRADITLAQLASAHADYQERHAMPLGRDWQAHADDRESEPLLRIGFVSAYFCSHPVGYFLIRAVENIDRGQCEIINYHDGSKRDELTNRFKAASTVWRETIGQSDDELAQQI